MVVREWVLKRNCALTPRQLGLAFVMLCALSLCVAGAFALSGFWYVLVFTLLEVLAVGVAFLLYARHALDRERIALDEHGLLVEVYDSDKMVQVRLDPCSTQVEPPAAGRPLVGFVANGIRAEVGRFLTERNRSQLARELRSALAATR